MLAFFTPSPKLGLGDASICMTAGNGSDGAGDAERLIDMPGDEAPKDDLRLWLMTLGGFMGRAIEVGVPGHDGAGDPITSFKDSCCICDRNPMSGGAGLFEEIRRPGRSIFILLPIFLGASSRLSKANWPSLVLSV